MAMFCWRLPNTRRYDLLRYTLHKFKMCSDGVSQELPSPWSHHYSLWILLVASLWLYLLLQSRHDSISPKHHLTQSYLWNSHRFFIKATRESASRLVKVSFNESTCLRRGCLPPLLVSKYITQTSRVCLKPLLAQSDLCPATRKQPTGTIVNVFDSETTTGQFLHVTFVWVWLGVYS